MGTIDFAPLFRSTIGFDRVFDLLDGVMRYGPTDDDPPYDIEKTGEDAYRITMAVAGFGPEDLSLTVQPNLLVVAGRKPAAQTAQYLHKGLTTHAFERRFNLADHVQVTGAGLENGLLSVDLVRELPEAMKPRRIPIGQALPPKAIESKPAEARTAA